MTKFRDNIKSAIKDKGYSVKGFCKLIAEKTGRTDTEVYNQLFRNKNIARTYKVVVAAHKELNGIMIKEAKS